MKEGMQIVQKQMMQLMTLMKNFALQYKDLPTLGFTHYQAAQLTTYLTLPPPLFLFIKTHHLFQMLTHSVGKRATLWLQDLMFDYQQLERWIDELPFRYPHLLTPSLALSLSPLLKRTFK